MLSFRSFRKIGSRIYIELTSRFEEEKIKKIIEKSKYKPTKVSLSKEIARSGYVGENESPLERVVSEISLAFDNEKTLFRFVRETCEEIKYPTLLLLESVDVKFVPVIGTNRIEVFY